jgi:hypothetical protein
MKTIVSAFCAAPLFAVSTPIEAADFDGSVPLLCAVTSTASCDAQGECIEGPANAVNLPVFVTIDVPSKIAQSTRAGGEKRTSEISSVQKGEGALVLLGVDQGAGWSVAIGESSGKMTLAVSGDGVGYLAMGTCTPK